MLEKIIYTDQAKTTILIRLITGPVFLSEGIQKFVLADTLGAGRFIKIGLPFPEFLAPFTGSFEIVCGTLVLFGLFARLAAIPLLTIMLVAIVSTKIPILINDGFWKMIHESRTDWSMLLGNIFILIRGAGKWSLDSYLSRNV